MKFALEATALGKKVSLDSQWLGPAIYLAKMGDAPFCVPLLHINLAFGKQETSLQSNSNNELRDGPLFFYQVGSHFGKPAHNFFSHSVASNNFFLSFYSWKQILLTKKFRTFCTKILLTLLLRPSFGISIITWLIIRGEMIFNYCIFLSL